MRYPVALLSGAVAAALLFLMMHGWLAEPPASPSVDNRTPPVAAVAPPAKKPEPQHLTRHAPPKPVNTAAPSTGLQAIHLPPRQIDPPNPRGTLSLETSLVSLRGLPGGVGPGLNSDAGPVRTAAVRPMYPAEARRSGQEGWVRLAFTVSASGTVKDVQVLDAEPRGLFERAAIRAVMRWQFRPAQQDGQPVASRVRQTLNFKLDNEPGGGML